MTTILNIGLNVGDKPTWDLGDVTLAIDLATENVKVLRAEVKQSTTEETVVVELSEPLTEKEADIICYWLKQDCIAQSVDGVGTLYGPKADEWGPFNPEYFLTF